MGGQLARRETLLTPPLRHPGAVYLQRGSCQKCRSTPPRVTWAVLVLPVISRLPIGAGGDSSSHDQVRTLLAANRSVQGLGSAGPAGMPWGDSRTSQNTNQRRLDGLASESVPPPLLLCGHVNYPAILATGADWWGITLFLPRDGQQGCRMSRCCRGAPGRRQTDRTQLR
ncbi:hypothetical protein LZ30DRAFT_351783 [Colletotrichum cereale]|nr:hypothetical protein LZ30DRAFT_351783 [Colletotrichum cereale]